MKPYCADDYYVRFNELHSLTTPHIDCLTPGHKKADCPLVGCGIIESKGFGELSGAKNTKLEAHLSPDVNFSMGTGGRVGPGNGTSLHSHPETEVFTVLRGRFQILSGRELRSCNDITLGRLDLISVPALSFRAFVELDQENVLFSLMAAQHPQKVTWAPNVITHARGRGLVLLENSDLIDTTKGYLVPENAKEKEPISEEEAAKFTVFSAEELEGCTFRYKKAKWHEFSYGLHYSAVLGPKNATPAFHLNDSSGLNIFLFKLHNRNKVGLKNSHHAILILFCGEINITLHLEDGLHTIWVKEGDTLYIPEGVHYDLNMMSNEAEYYLYVSDNYSTIKLA
ncbi:MAG: hypothetical protein Q8R79_05185 [Legionellaceae bacterium]|nr:hypothetical protein [Legionellaceae bacterium]